MLLKAQAGEEMDSMVKGKKTFSLRFFLPGFFFFFTLHTPCMYEENKRHHFLESPGLKLTN